MQALGSRLQGSRQILESVVEGFAEPEADSREP